MSLYDDHYYGENHRITFPPKEIGTTGAVTLKSRWYPKGPIRVTKFGVIYSVATSGSELTISLKKGASASVVATIVASTTTAQWTVASKGSLTQLVGVGSYLSITTDGTADAGSAECFIDYTQLPHKNHLAGAA